MALIVHTQASEGQSASFLAGSIVDSLSPLLPAMPRSQQRDLHILGGADSHLSGLTDTVAEELDLCCRIAAEQRQRIISTIGIDRLLGRAPMTLSGGEKARLVIAAAMLSAPTTLAIGDAFDALDFDGRRAVLALGRDGFPGHVLVICSATSIAGVDVTFRIGEDDRIIRVATPPIDYASHPSPLPSNGLRIASVRGLPSTALRIERGLISRGSFCLGPLSIEVRVGSLVIIEGRNGSGKTSLLRVLAGIDSLASGALEKVSLGTQRLRCYYSVQEPDIDVAQLSILDECVRAAGGRWSPSQMTAKLSSLGLATDTAQANMWDSKSQRRLAGVLAATMSGAGLVLLDEPTGGLADSELETVVKAISTSVAGNSSVMIATHDNRMIEAIRSRFEDDVLFHPCPDGLG